MIIVNNNHYYMTNRPLYYWNHMTCTQQDNLCKLYSYNFNRYFKDMFNNISVNTIIIMKLGNSKHTHRQINYSKLVNFADIYHNKQINYYISIDFVDKNQQNMIYQLHNKSNQIGIVYIDLAKFLCTENIRQSNLDNNYWN